ncbi:MAG TPA: GNAT family N-acetyltransferase [Lentimicrobium sp.]|jgi:GNAT superfamily N-acetyltransferase|nr:GNAT family N-acetyltransferase [Lentimicrobium sp.]
MSEISANTWWLQMTAPPTPEEKTKILPEGCLVMQAVKPTRSFYLFLYTSVGRPYQWYNRLMIPAGELDRLLQDEKTTVWVLYVNGVPAGFAEFDATITGETEMVYFGLTCEFTGKGLGMPFLKWCIHKAWEQPLSRLWLHTCDLDHPAALHMYRKAGFAIYDQDTLMQQKPDPEDDPYLLLPW